MVLSPWGLQGPRHPRSPHGLSAALRGPGLSGLALDFGLISVGFQLAVAWLSVGFRLDFGLIIVLIALTAL